MTIAIKQEKDTYAFQRSRVLRLLNELAPGKLVEFDEASSMIRFRVRDEILGVNLIETSGHWFPSEIADKSDEELRLMVKNLSNGRIG